MAIKYSFKI